MSRTRIIHAGQTDASAELRALRRPLLLDRLILEDAPETRSVREIIADVCRRGDEAVSQITARLDHADVPPDRVRATADDIERARHALPADLLEAVRHSIRSVREFQSSLLAARPRPITVGGKTLSLRSRPVRRVGVWVPGAAAPLLSSVIHSAVPAQVAGVKEVAIAAPPRHKGDIHPAILGVAGELGITEVYRMGGTQGIAALAVGTQRVSRVDTIVGPGSVYVQLAKRLLYGVVDIDMFAGPSEVVIIADVSARPAFVAIDMLAQAEHDPGCAILLTDQPQLAEQVAVEIDRHLATLSRREGAARCLDAYGAIVVVRDMDEAVALTNEIAPEHLEIATKSPAELADRIDSAGAIFLGHYTPEAAGDYVAGPSHVLPTGGTARFWSGVSALTFIRRTSLIDYTAEGLAADAAAIDLLARAEGLDAHARSATIRVDDTRPGH